MFTGVVAFYPPSLPRGPPEGFMCFLPRPLSLSLPCVFIQWYHQPAAPVLSMTPSIWRVPLATGMGHSSNTFVKLAQHLGNTALTGSPEVKAVQDLVKIKKVTLPETATLTKYLQTNPYFPRGFPYQIKVQSSIICSWGTKRRTLSVETSKTHSRTKLIND